MGLGTKNRQKQTADICKQHLRQKYRNKLGLVEGFIVEFEGSRKDCDITRWGQFTDIKDIKEEMLTRLEVLGRFLITKKEKDIASFKTPDIRNVLVTGVLSRRVARDALGRDRPLQQRRRLAESVSRRRHPAACLD
jgi:hypothetical protein